MKFRPYVMEVIIGLFLMFSIGPIVESESFALAKNHSEKKASKERGFTGTVDDKSDPMPHSETKSQYDTKEVPKSESIGDHSKDDTSRANRKKSNRKIQ